MEKIETGFKSLLRNYYLASFFYDFVFAYAIYTVFFSIKGLSVFQISLILAWWSLTTVLLEIPTGLLADSWSRRKMLVIAPIFKALCFVAWFMAGSNIYIYALGFLFWSLGSSFVSGTTQAFLYDAVSHANKKDDYEKILSRKKSYFNIALAISIVSGGFIAGYNINFAIIFSVVPLLLSSLFAFLLPEQNKVDSTEEANYLLYLKIALKEIFKNRVLLILFIYAFAISIFSHLEEFDQLYYQLAKLPLFAFGLIEFVWAAANAGTSFFAHKLNKYSFIYWLIPLVCSLLLFFVGVFPSIPMIGLLIFSYVLAAPLNVLIEGKIQRSINSASRATITSASNLVINLFGVLLILFFGFIGRIWSLTAIYIISAIFLLLFAIWVRVEGKIFLASNTSQ